MLITAILVIVLLMLLLGVKTVRFLFWVIVLIIIIGVNFGTKSGDAQTLTQQTANLTDEGPRM